MTHLDNIISKYFRPATSSEMNLALYKAKAQVCFDVIIILFNYIG